MKFRILLLLFLVGFYVQDLSAQDITGGRKYLKIAKKVFKRDPMSPRISSSIHDAFRKDKNNPEIFFLSAVYFYNLDRDKQKATEAMQKFKQVMAQLKSGNGGDYKVEYKRLTPFLNKNTFTKEKLGNKLYLQAWQIVDVKDTRALCLENVRKAKSFLDSGNLTQAKDEINNLRTNCAKSDDELKQTAQFLDARYQLLNNNLGKSFQLDTNIKTVNKEFISSFERYEAELRRQVNAFANKILGKANQDIQAERWTNAQEKLNTIIMYFRLLKPEHKSEYHYQYAQLYLNQGNIEKAKTEIKKAEKLKLNEDKIVAFLSRLSQENPDPSLEENPPSESPPEVPEPVDRQPRFREIITKVQRELKRGDLNEASRVLATLKDPTTLDKDQQSTFLLFKAKINIRKKNYNLAMANIIALQDMHLNENIVQGVKIEFSSEITSFLRTENLNTAKDTYDELESALQNKIIPSAYAGLAYYELAKAYKGVDKNKFKSFKIAATRFRYNSNKLTALNWSDQPANSVANNEHQWPDDSVTPGPGPGLKVEGVPFTLTILSDDDETIYLTEKRRIMFDGPLVTKGIQRSKRTNIPIPLESATGYEIELENLPQTSNAETSKNWYFALMITSVVGSLIFIR